MTEIVIPKYRRKHFIEMVRAGWFESIEPPIWPQSIDVWADLQDNVFQYITTEDFLFEISNIVDDGKMLLPPAEIVPIIRSGHYKINKKHKGKLRFNNKEDV